MCPCSSPYDIYYCVASDFEVTCVPDSLGPDGASVPGEMSSEAHCCRGRGDCARIRYEVVDIRSPYFLV